jgi:hypothetical protein
LANDFWENEGAIATLPNETVGKVSYFQKYSKD